MENLRQIFKKSPSSHTQMSNPTFTPQNPPLNQTPMYTPTPTTSSSHLTVLELFQSQGCDSCPPANDFLISNFSADPRVLLLTYEVTYWDHLGWPDTFGDKRWDERQRDYAAVLGQRSVYTPQVVVDGGARSLSSWRELPRVLGGGKQESELKVEIVGRDGRRVVEVEGEKREWSNARVLAVWYEEQPADVKILRGENRGVTLPHRNVVRDLVAIGEFGGGQGKFEIPGDKMGLRMCVLVQAGRGGRILGAARLS